jgi:antitoxin ParD1/3/4
MTDDSQDAWDRPDDRAKRLAQARALRQQARSGGLRFEAYLPPALADWLLAHIERGTFRDPSEAVFVIFGEHEDLEPHSDLRHELLKRSLQAALDDPRPGIPAEEVFSKLRKRMQDPRAEPAVWRKLP